MLTTQTSELKPGAELDAAGYLAVAQFLVSLIIGQPLIQRRRDPQALWPDRGKCDPQEWFHHHGAAARMRRA